MKSNSAAPMPWNVAQLQQVPRTFAALEWSQPNVEAVWIQGVPASVAGEKLPAMVLVHSGGGTAFPEWVELWNGRGYAAIAIDTSGNVPDKANWYGQTLRHEMAGPPGWGGLDAQIDESVEDQWTYHAIANVLLSTSFLAAQPNVNRHQIGITGVSWGGYLTCIAASIDERFQFAAPVYGSGFLGDDSVWLPEFEKMGAERAQKWLDLWEPSRYIGRIKTPFLWVTGTNDFAYFLPSLQKTYRLLSPQEYSLSIRVRMPHGHNGPGENPAEIRAFADSFFKKGAPLTRIVSQSRQGENAVVHFVATKSVVSAELNFTRDAGAWVNRDWQTIPAQLNAKKPIATAQIPAGTTAYYVNIVDENGLVASSPHEEMSTEK